MRTAMIIDRMFVEELEAGKELNLLIGEHVMGWKQGRSEKTSQSPFSYSYTIHNMFDPSNVWKDTLSVIDAIRRSMTVNIQFDPIGVVCFITPIGQVTDLSDHRVYLLFNRNVSLVVCRTALWAVYAEKHLGEQP
jgi:hypothetical protein